MRTSILRVLGGTTIASVLLVTASARAQILSDEPAPAPGTAAPAAPSTAPAPAPAAAPAPAPAAVAPAAPAAPQAAQVAPAAAPAAADDTGPDQDQFVGHLGVTYFGISQLPIADQNGTQQTITAPVLGVRYWMKRSLGLDLGVGFALSSGSVTAGGTSASLPGQFGLAVHGGVPINLATGKHYAFQVIPETTLGFTSGSFSPGGGAPDVSLSGFRFDIGARAGAEIHFGFIGIPQLALVASIGLYIHDQAWSATPSGKPSTGESQLSIATSVQNDPWSIFADNISAIYYF
jgi:hypothetical protein